MSRRSVAATNRSNEKDTKNIQKKTVRSKRKAAYRFTGALITVLIIITLSVFFSNKLVSAHGNVDKSVSNKTKYYKSIQIQKGDTLWQIAEQNMSDEYDSITDYILEVKRINNLASDNIQSSQYLTIPYYNIPDEYTAKR